MGLPLAWRTLKDYATGLAYSVAVLSGGTAGFYGLQAQADTNGSPVNPATSDQLGTIGTAPPTLPGGATGLMGLLLWLGQLLTRPIRMTPAASTMIDHSTLTASPGSALLMPSNAARRGWLIQAPLTADLWINLAGGAASVGGAGCFRIPAGTFQRSTGASVETGAFTYFCATSGLQIAATEL